jgi:hypothetical protein
MSNNSFKVKNGLTLNPIDLATNPPLNPQAGDLICDSSDNNKIKRYDANAAAWTEVGSGGVGGVDIFFVQDFESASLNTFSGTSGSQVGLVLTQTDPLKGKVSALLTHQTAIDQSLKQIIPVDRKFRGIPMVLRLDSKSSASQGNVTINIYDETNNANIVASEQLQLSNDTAGKKTSISFTIPATCASISYTITALPQSGSPTTIIDDIICEIAETALLETAVTVPNMTAWQGYTPTFQGFGTPTNVEFEWRQVGENVEIRGKFTSGTPSTAVETRVGLPSGLISANTGLIPSLQVIGKGNQSFSGTTNFSSFSVLIEPSVNYITFGVEASTSNGVTKSLGGNFVTSGVVSFFASVPCAGLSATTTKSIPLTQSGLIQEADSYYHTSGAIGYGSTATNARRLNLSNGTMVGSDAFTVTDSSTLGTRIIINKTGIYNISYSDTNNVAADGVIHILVNGLPRSLERTGAEAGEYSATTSFTGILNKDDVVTFFMTVGSTATFETYLTMSYQGSLKQVNINPNSKITIPTSELRFTGSSSRGTADAGARVKFDTLSSIRGDAFTITNDATGTSITMKKAGKLSVSSSLVTSSATYSQIVVGGKIVSAFDVSGNGGSGSWDGSVVVGDVIYVVAGVNPNGNAAISLNLSFQEQDISVSVTNTLPQFSESDSSVRVSGANGFTGTTRLFANVLQNIGNAINYVPATGQFIAREAGIYNVSYSEGSTANINSMGVFIQLNGTNIASDNQIYNTANTTIKRASASWSGYLNEGDIITAVVGSTTENNGDTVLFTISKVGKPNVTGVDVTPFVNVPQSDKQSSIVSQTANFTNADITGTLSVSNGSSSIYSYNSSTGIYTALKAATINMSAAMRQSATSAIQSLIIHSSKGTIGVGQSDAATSQSWCSSSATFDVLTGDTWKARNGAGGTSDIQIITVSAIATSNQILTIPETFSTDTASLTYAGSGTYTLSTLANAPVGTYITFTYAANTNTRTQTTTRPTQTDADMNANGILIYTRAYNASSSAAQPAAVAIQIGKGMKGKSLDLYKSVGKVTAGSLDFVAENATSSYGAFYKDYNEITGILIVDAGVVVPTTNTTRSFQFIDITVQTSGYLVINASKNPALTGIGLNRVAARAVQSSGQSIASSTNVTLTWDATKFYDTHGALNTATGIFTAPETGYYQVNASIRSNTNTGAYGSFQVRIFKNGGLISYVNQPKYATINVSSQANISDVIYLTKGDSLSIVAFQDSGVALALLNDPQTNFVSISKISV